MITTNGTGRETDCTHPEMRLRPGRTHALAVLPSDQARIRPSRASRRRAWVLVGVHVLILLHMGHWLATGKTLTPVEPSEAKEFFTSGEINAGLIFLAAAVFSTMILGRWLCGWGCHLVAYQDLTAWAMKKLHLRPRAFRSRLLLWVPLAAAIYMFFGGLLDRWWHGVPAAGASWHLMRTGFWDTFPGPVVAVTTLLACGGAIILILGPKGFCTYACPYGALFVLAEKVSVWRIRVTDACRQCGHCTAVCTSNVDVAREVNLYGMVVDPGCMKCLDCVSVCPNDALYFGAGTIPLLGMARPPEVIRDNRHARRPPRKFDLSLKEDLLALAVFGCIFFGWRGLYSQIPFLLALGLAGMGAFLTLKAAQMFYRPDVLLQRIRLKVGGRLRATGWAYLAAVAGLLALTIHGGIWNAHSYVGRRAWAGMPAETLDWPYQPDFSHRMNEDRRRAALDGLEHYRWCRGWGLLDDPINALREGWLLVVLGRRSEAIERLRDISSRRPDETNLSLALGRVMIADGDRAGSVGVLREAIARETSRRSWVAAHPEHRRTLLSELHRELAGQLAISGDQTAAQEQLILSRTADPQSATALLTLGDIHLMQGDVENARGAYLEAAELEPQRPEVAERLTRIRKHEPQDFMRASEEYAAALGRPASHPHALVHNRAYALAAVRRYAEARVHYEWLLKQTPADAEAATELYGVLLASNDLEAAAGSMERLQRHLPDDVPTMLRLAGVYEQMGRIDAARKQLAQVIKTGGEKDRGLAEEWLRELGTGE